MKNSRAPLHCLLQVVRSLPLSDDGRGEAGSLRDQGPAGPLPRRVHAACVGVVVFAVSVVVAHDLVWLNRAYAQGPDESVFNGLVEGWGAQDACGTDGLGYGYVGGFDAVVDAEGVEPLEIVTAHVCCVEPVVCVDCDVFTRSVALDCHVACAAGHDWCTMGSIGWVGYGKMLNEPEFFCAQGFMPRTSAWW